MKILMRRLIKSRLIWILTVCKCMSEFTCCPKLPDFTLYFLSLCLLVSSADSISKRFGSISGLTKCQACSGCKLFDTLIVLLRYFFKKLILKQIQQETKKHEKLPSMQRVHKETLNYLILHTRPKFVYIIH